MASKSFLNISKAPCGSATPSLRYFSAPQSNSTNSRPAAKTSFTRRNTRIDSRVTSMPIPSPGITAIRFMRVLCRMYEQVVLGEQGLLMGLFVLRKIHENLSTVFVGYLIRKISKELVRAPLEIHGDVKSVDVAGPLLDFEFQQFLLWEDLFHDFPAQW